VIQPGGPEEPNVTETPTATEGLNITSEEPLSLEHADDGIVVRYDGEDPIDEIDYVVEDGDGNEVIDEEQDFDDPTDYFEDQYDEDILDNATNDTSYDDWTGNYSGVTSDGESFNGSLEANEIGYSLDPSDEDDDSGGISAPPSGGGGGSTPTWLIGIPAIAAVGYVVARRRGLVG
jgi:hypothetical protein